MALFTTVKAGNWNAASTWGSGSAQTVPTATDTAKLLHQVTLTANAAIAGIDTTSTGALIANSGSYYILVGANGVLFRIFPLVF